MKKIYKIWFPTLMLAVCNVVYAEGYNIGTADPALFGKITKFLQDVVNFMTGPYGKAVVIISLCLAVSVWIFSPREGWIGFFGRAFAGGQLLLNVSLWLGIFT